MDIDELAAQRPGNIEEALDAMRKGLHYYHEKNDRRAIFLRLYYMMTLEVYSAIHGCRAYKGRRIFMDADWIFRLSGKFSTLYFASLVTPEGDRAWQIAHSVAKQPGSSVVQNALLGINAHINFDLPRAIAANLDPAELPDYEIMQKRKFDHDQVNNLLVRTVNPVQRVLAKNYEPGIAVVDRVLGGFDERACAVAAADLSASRCGGTRSPSPPPSRASSRRSSGTSWSGSPTISRSRSGVPGCGAPSAR